MSIAPATCAPGVNGLLNTRVPLTLPPCGSLPLPRGSPPVSTVLRIVRRLAGHRDVVDVAFTQSGSGDPHKGTVLLHLADRAVAGIAHRRPQPTDQLVNNVADRSLVRDAAFDTLGHELQ